MDLGERGARDRCRIEGGKQFGPPAAELGAKTRLDLRGRTRRDSILERLEVGAKVRGQEVAEDAHQLADLDEQPLHFKDRRLDPPRAAPMAGQETLGAAALAAPATGTEDPAVVQQDAGDRRVDAE